MTEGQGPPGNQPPEPPPPPPGGWAPPPPPGQGPQSPQAPMPGQPGPVPPMQGGVQVKRTPSSATIALVLGILGVTICSLAAPFAWWQGQTARNEIDASGGTLDGRGMATAGYIMGIIGTVILALAIVIIVIAIAAGASSA